MSIISRWPSWWLSLSSLLLCKCSLIYFLYSPVIFHYRLIVLITIRRGISKLQKQIKKIIHIMSMSPPPSRRNTLEKNHVRMKYSCGWLEVESKDLYLLNGFIFLLAYFFRFNVENLFAIMNFSSNC